MSWRSGCDAANADHGGLVSSQRVESCADDSRMLSWTDLVSLYRIHDKAIPNLRGSYNLAPTEDASVIIQGQDGLTHKAMRWGLVPGWAKDLKIGSQCINARIESAPEKAAFRQAWKYRRCIVPASGYFEWRTVDIPGQKKPLKQPYYVTRKDGLPWSFAGLWERWGGDDLLTFTILTMDASPAIRELHDRQPVILDDSAVESWIASGNIGLPNNLDSNVQIAPVTPKMNSPHYKEPDCIVALTGSDGRT
jgi:putative SOS response-associated peptidase YedK